MGTKRQDAWKDEDDLILAETILRHIRVRSTRLAAFEEAGNTLNRTASACGFRWNSEVRKQYENEIIQAKIERAKTPKNQNREIFVTVSDLSTVNPSDKLPKPKDVMDQIIELINIQKGDFNNLQKQIRKLDEENEKLKRQIKDSKPHENIISEDYQALLQIMNRARGLGVLDKA
jgi:prespore-specific regulator